MKKRILAAVLAVVMLLPMALSIFAADDEKIAYESTTWESKQDRLSKMGSPIATSPDKNLEMYVDKNSGEMAIKNLKTGDIILSNPYTIGSSPLPEKEKPHALSQLELNFTYKGSSTSTTFYSYNDAFAVDQATITETENGIKVDYVLGEQFKQLMIPYKISVDDMEALLQTIPSSSHRDYIRGRYNIYCSLDGANSINQNYPTLQFLYPWLMFPTEDNVKACLEKYPICATTPIYVFSEGKSEAETIERYFRNSSLVDNSLTGNDRYQALADYINTSYEKVKEEDKDQFSSTETPKFEISATYKLTNSGLVATVDAGSLEYDRTKYTVNTVSILPYFNAANASRNIEVDDKVISTCDKGYTFIPDGSGALVRFEDLYADNKKQVKFENDIYGNDYAYYQVKTKNAENMTMPVFGLSNHTEKTGFLAIIEDGDAMGIIVSNHSTAYHSIYTSFKLTPSDVYDLADSFSSGTSSSKEIGITSTGEYRGLCQVNYNLLTDDEVAKNAGVENYYSNTYVGMAKLYREYLQDKKLISKIPENQINKDFTKLFLETFGSIKVEEKIATFPVTVNKELTTFDDIKTMYNDLKAAGVGNTSFILKGFANGGLLSKYATSVKWQKVLGGKKGFNDLLKYAEENGFEVAPDIDFSYSYGYKAFSGVSNKKNGVRTLDNRYTTKRAYYAATQTFERTGGVAVSSASFEYIYEKFYKSMSKYDVEYLATRTLGSDLNSDFDEDDYYDREASKDNVVAMLKLLAANADRSYKLILDAGNSYAMPYASSVLSASLDSSRRSEMSESVPFFGMVYHGCVEFAGNAYNMEGDTEYAFLKALENGAVLYFTVAKQNVELLKFDTEYNKYYSVSYDNLKDQIVATYKEYNELMKGLQDKYIVDHQFIGTATRVEDGGAVDASQVVMVEYEGGVGFVLNYTNYTINVTMPNGEKTTIDPFGYDDYTK